MKIRKMWLSCAISLVFTVSACGLSNPQNHTNPTSRSNELASSEPAYDGQIKLEINPALADKKYTKYQATDFSTGGGFAIQANKSTNPVQPVLECVKNNGNGTFTAYFGYLNQNNSSVEIPLGTKNKIMGGFVGQGANASDKIHSQPTQFASGRSAAYPNYVFSVDFDHGNVTYVLDGSTIVANQNSAACTGSPSPSPI